MQRSTQDSRPLGYDFSYAQALLCCGSMTTAIGTRPAITQRTAYAQHASSWIAYSIYSMCCCIALHISAAGQLHVRWLLVYQPHMPLPRYCLMMRKLLPYSKMTLWQEQRMQLLHAIITFRYHCMESVWGMIDD